MYLVPAENYDHSRPQSQPLPPLPVKLRPNLKTKRVAKKGKTDIKHPHDKWVVLCTKLLEADIKESPIFCPMYCHNPLPRKPRNYTHQLNRVPKSKCLISGDATSIPNSTTDEASIRG